MPGPLGPGAVLLHGTGGSVVNESRTEESSEEFTDEATGRRMRRTTTVTFEWVEGISRYHGDPDGWNGWVEVSRDVKVVPIDGGAPR